jgi:hypothetical protein
LVLCEVRDLGKNQQQQTEKQHPQASPRRTHSSFALLSRNFPTSRERVWRSKYSSVERYTSGLAPGSVVAGMTPGPRRVRPRRRAGSAATPVAVMTTACDDAAEVPPPPPLPSVAPPPRGDSTPGTAVARNSARRMRSVASSCSPRAEDVDDALGVAPRISWAIPTAKKTKQVNNNSIQHRKKMKASGCKFKRHD